MPTTLEDPVNKIPRLSERLEHYRVPEGYFGSLSDRILSQIPFDEDSLASDRDTQKGSHQTSHPWLKLTPWISVAAVLIAVVALWAIWQDSFQLPILPEDRMASSVYDINVTPLTDAEYADYLYESCIQVLVEEDALGGSLEGY